MPPVKTLRSEKRYAGRVFSLIVDEVEYPSGKRGVREVAVHDGGAVTVPLMDDGAVLLVSQFRYPMRKALLELPAGKLDSGEDPAVGAARELAEETGYTAERLTKLTAIYTTPGFCNEQLHIFLATGLKRSAGGQQLDEAEIDLEVKAIPFDEVMQMIDDQIIVDSKTICGILLTDRLVRSGQLHIPGSNA